MEPGNKKVAIVLASGVSKRFGSENKLMMPIDGKSIIEATIENLEQSDIDRIITVTGHQGGRVRRALKNHDTIFIDNPDYAKGFGTSIHAGISSLGVDVAAVLIVLGDMPFVGPKTINLILRAHENSKGKLIFIPTYRGKRGNPVLWDKTLFPELLKLASDQGGKKIFHENPEIVKEINVGSGGILVDIDLPKELKARQPPANLIKS